MPAEACRSRSQSSATSSLPGERGRYPGCLTGTFALASLLGPLVGGFLTDKLSRRWVFYLNLPIGAVALAVIAVVLGLPFPTIHIVST